MPASAWGGLKKYNYYNFVKDNKLILAADNLQITNSYIAQAIQNTDPEPIVEMVLNCENSGAEIIDINSGHLSRDAELKMTFLVNTVQETSELPVIIDTANPVAIEAGLRANKKKAVINGFSLAPQRLAQVLPLAKKYKADIIGYLLYPDGHVPMNGQERLDIAIELLKEFDKEGIDRDRLIIDPVLVPISWENGNLQAMEVLSVIKLLPEVFGFPVRTIIGLSNLTTGEGHRKKKLFLERAYLSMLASSGLSIALLNIFHPETVKTASACRALMNEKIFTWEALQI